MNTGEKDLIRFLRFICGLSECDPPPDRVRFEATIHPRDPVTGSDWMDQLKVDRVPDPQGQLRALLTADDCVRILEQGFDIHLSFSTSQ